VHRDSPLGADHLVELRGFARACGRACLDQDRDPIVGLLGSGLAHVSVPASPAIDASTCSNERSSRSSSMRTLSRGSRDTLNPASWILSIVNRGSAAQPDLRTANPPPRRRTQRGTKADQPPKACNALAPRDNLISALNEQADNRSSPQPALQQTFLGPSFRHERDGRHDEPGPRIGPRCRREDRSLDCRTVSA